MRIIIVGASPYKTFNKIYYHQDGDYLIGVDGGCQELKGYPIDLAIGDFDSLDMTLKAKKILTYPTHKNETDLELALLEISDKEAEILVYNVTGGRLDHFLASVWLLRRFQELNIKILDEYNEIRLLLPGEYRVVKTEYSYLSFIPLEESIISSEGVLYPLDRAIVKKEDTYAVSNQIIKEAKISIHQGMLLMIQTK